jgi:glutamate synthase (NADPH/NADH) large chain
MTNGAVLNLGSFGKGLCNGMSGGNTYQYDPENKLEKLSDTSSVEIRQLTEDSDTARAHEQFVLSMLEQHIEYAESSIATNLLANWQVERKHFKFSIPLWLYKTQTAEFIAKSLDRKVIIEELSVNEAQKKMTLVQQAYANGTALFNGKAPSFGEFDSPLALHLINSFAVLNKATIIAANQTKNVVKMEQIAQTLIMNKAKPLQDALVKETRAAYDNYDDAQLAILLANKRLEDYKQALILRDVQSIYSIGSTHWIIDQSAINTHALKDIPTVDTYLANLNSQSVIQNMMKATEDA